MCSYFLNAFCLDKTFTFLPVSICSKCKLFCRGHKYRRLGWRNTIRSPVDVQPVAHRENTDTTEPTSQYIYSATEVFWHSGALQIGLLLLLLLQEPLTEMRFEFCSTWTTLRNEAVAINNRYCKHNVWLTDRIISCTANRGIEITQKSILEFYVLKWRHVAPSSGWNDSPEKLQICDSYKIFRVCGYSVAVSCLAAHIFKNI